MKLHKIEKLLPMSLFNTLTETIKRGNTRSVKAKKNIISSFLIRGSNILLGLLTVPLTLHYLGDVKYGLWLTIGSFIEYMSFFNLGLDHGFRNRFAEALATDQHNKAKIYVSTVYASLAVISILLVILFFIINPFLNWASILNSSQEMAEELSMLVTFVFVGFSIQFILQLIKTILIADQRPAFGHLFNLIAKIISLGFILVLIKTTEGSLLFLGTGLSLSPILVLFISSFFFFNSRYKKYKPSIKHIRFNYLKSLMNLGIKFFVIQIAVIIIFSTDNLIITRLYGPADVTPYQIAFKYFSLITMAYTIIVSPLWSAFTEAWVKKDISWIKGIIRRIQKIWLFFLFITLLMVVSANFIYKFWVGDEVKIPFILTLIMGLYVIIRAYGEVYVNFVNGTGKVKLQFYTAIFSAIANIPLSVFFAKGLNLGIAGVILATLICISYGPIVAPIQARIIISGKSKGIWSK